MRQYETYRNINELEQVDKQPNNTESDFKAEVVAAELIEKGFDPEQIQIIRMGSGRRGYSKDIEDISIQFSQQDLRDYLNIRKNKGGIYDILPEGIFHQPINRRLQKDKEDILEEMKIHRNQEIFAKKFFHLFEAEVDHTLVDGYLYESKYEKKISNPNFVNIFIPYWPVLKLLTREQAIRFLHIMPILHKIRNQYKEIAGSMSMILDVPVKISNIKLPAKKAGNFFESHLGENHLGIDWVLGHSFDDGLYDLKMTIGPVSAEGMEQFLERGKGSVILDTLCELFLPADVFIVKEFNISSEDASFILSSAAQVTYLGINTFI